MPQNQPLLWDGSRDAFFAKFFTAKHQVSIMATLQVLP